MPLLSLVTAAAPAVACWSRGPLAASHFLGSFPVPPPPWISSFLPLLASLSPRPGHSSSAASSFLLTLCLQHFLPLICGRRGAGGEGEQGKVSSLRPPLLHHQQSPVVSSLIPRPELSTPVVALRLNSPSPGQGDLFRGGQSAVVPSGPLKPLPSSGMGPWDVCFHLFFPERRASQFCHSVARPPARPSLRKSI